MNTFSQKIKWKNGNSFEFNTDFFFFLMAIIYRFLPTNLHLPSSPKLPVKQLSSDISA